MHNALNFIDIFAGGGGLSEGFAQAGFEPIAHVEADEASCNTLRTRMAYRSLNAEDRQHVYADYLDGRLERDALYAEVPSGVVDSVINAIIRRDNLKPIFAQIDTLLQGRSLDVLVGGPPCQAYSIVGRSRDPDRMVEDKRNVLYRCYGAFLERYQPKRFVFENVSGLASAKSSAGRSYLDTMRRLFKRHGYQTEASTLLANDYGVLQRRKRIVLVGSRSDVNAQYPALALWKPDVTVKEVFGDLPAIGAGEGTAGPCSRLREKSQWRIDAGIEGALPLTWHQARPHAPRDLEIYRIAVEQWNERQSRLRYSSLPERLKTHRNATSFVDRFKVVAADLPFAQTVVAHISKDGHYYIHPDLKQNRSITPREAARIQTFPDDYYFESANGRPARTHAFRQIGNAVPVLLARRLAATIAEDWDA